LIAGYATVEWESKAISSWELRSIPRSIISYKEHLYICLYNPSHIVSIRNLNDGQMFKVITTFNFPHAIDLDLKNSLFYLADSFNMTILNLNFEIITSWKLPSSSHSSFAYRGIKVEENILFLTMEGHNQIFKCISSNGKVNKKFGTEKESSKQGKFHSPFNLALNNQSLYVCDCHNNRVQVITKKDGNFITQWGSGHDSDEEGNFSLPYSIYRDIEDMFYIGDSTSVQVFTSDGKCLQRIGQENDLKEIFGICVVDDRLFISDRLNRRILIFKAK